MEKTQKADPKGAESKTPDRAFFGGNHSVNYKDGNFEFQISSPDATFVTETIDNLFNEQAVAKRLEDILTGVEVPPIVREKLDKVFSVVKQTTDEGQQAIDKNTPTT